MAESRIFSAEIVDIDDKSKDAVRVRPEKDLNGLYVIACTFIVV